MKAATEVWVSVWVSLRTLLMALLPFGGPSHPPLSSATPGRRRRICFRTTSERRRRRRRRRRCLWSGTGFLEAILKPLGDHLGFLGVPGASCGASSGRLGTSLLGVLSGSVLEIYWDSLWGLLGAPWGILGASWAPPGASWAPLGGPMGPLGGLSGPPEAL